MFPVVVQICVLFFKHLTENYRNHYLEDSIVDTLRWISQKAYRFSVNNSIDLGPNTNSSRHNTPWGVETDMIICKFYI